MFLQYHIIHIAKYMLLLLKYISIYVSIIESSYINNIYIYICKLKNNNNSINKNKNMTVFIL